MQILTTIAARGGSKGVKNKNIRMLMGKPLIVHSIEQAKAWGGYEHLVVSTDSKEIAEIAKQYGAEVPFLRPPNLATDEASKVDALRHALLACEKFFQKKFDALLDLDATAPIREVRDLEKITALFQKHQPDYIFSVVKARRNPYFNMVEISPDGKPVLCKLLPSALVRRQDAPMVYDMNASLYIYKRAFLLEPGQRLLYNGNAMIYEMPEETAFDIDHEVDFEIVEFLLRRHDNQ